MLAETERQGHMTQLRTEKPLEGRTHTHEGHTHAHTHKRSQSTHAHTHTDCSAEEDEEGVDEAAHRHTEQYCSNGHHIHERYLQHS